MRTHQAVLPDELLCSVEQPYSIKAHSQRVELRATRDTGGFRSFWHASIPTLWATFAIYVALVAVVFVCRQHRVKSLGTGVPKRSLAGKYEDFFDSPQSPELEQLCSSLGHWTPAETSPGNPRASPHIVEEFFAALETDERSGAAPPVSEGAATMEVLTGSATPGPRAESAIGSNVKLPDSSLRFPTFQGHLQTSQHAPSPPAIDQTPPFRPSHPFVRMPALQQGVTPRPWSSSISAFSGFIPLSSQSLLRRVRELLLLPTLDACAAADLVIVTEQLAAYAMQRLSTAAAPNSAADAVLKYGRRFLVLTAIHSSAHAIGQPNPPWWQEVVAGVLQCCECDTTAPRARRSSFLLLLARDLRAALLKYKNGGSPTLKEVLDLKRQLLCNPKTHSWFWRSDWNLWREDDKEN